MAPKYRVQNGGGISKFVLQWLPHDFDDEVSQINNILTNKTREPLWVNVITTFKRLTIIISIL